MIIELAGLPGSGKSTICRALSKPRDGKGSVPLYALHLTPTFFRALWGLLALALTARPFRPNRLKRAVNAALLLRHYQPNALRIVLDQGTVQKLWSILSDADTFHEKRLQSCLSSLAPFAPDHLVWIDTPFDLALQRLAARTAGNSRYDGIPPEKATTQLAERAALLKTIAERLVNVAGRDLIVLDGTRNQTLNAAEVEKLLSKWDRR